MYREEPSDRLELPIFFFCSDVLLHEFSDNFILGVKLVDLCVLLGRLSVKRAWRAERILNLSHGRLDPIVDHRGLHIEFIGDLRNRDLVLQVPANGISFLSVSERTSFLRDIGILLRW